MYIVLKQNTAARHNMEHEPKPKQNQKAERQGCSESKKVSAMNWNYIPFTLEQHEVILKEELFLIL